MCDYVVDDEGKEIEEEGGGGTSREGACVEKKGLAVAAFFEAVANQQRERERPFQQQSPFSTVVSRRIGLGLRSCFRNAVNNRNKLDTTVNTEDQIEDPRRSKLRPQSWASLLPHKVLNKMTSEQDTEDDEDVSKGQTTSTTAQAPHQITLLIKYSVSLQQQQRQKLGLLTRALLHAFFDYLDIGQQNWLLMS